MNIVSSNYDADDDPQLVFDELVGPIESQMVRTIGRLVRTPEAAADVVQETLTSVWANLARVRRHPNPAALILRMCINKAHDSLRRSRRSNRRENSLEVGPHPAIPQSQLTQMMARQNAVLIQEAIGRLPSKQAEVVVLRMLEEASYARIAEIVGCSEATAHSHYSKGIQRLRTILEPMISERTKRDD